MHLRFSTCIGTPVHVEGIEHAVGYLSGILIEPDTGKIEGFFVRSLGLIRHPDLFLSTLDITRWGTRIIIRDTDVLSPPEDRIRLQPLLDDPRTILGQQIRTESGTLLGRCADVQFNTEAMHVEWLFPKKFFRYGIALSISQVLEVKSTVILVKDSIKKEASPQPSTELLKPTLPEVETPRLG